jgi:hypothetical protein
MRELRRHLEGKLLDRLRVATKAKTTRRSDS